MTEQEWLSGVDPGAMERFLRDMTSARKARLYACACCHRIWAEMTDPRSRRAVEVAEAYADGRATEEQLRGAHAGADEAAFNYIDDVLNMAEIASSAGLELNGWIAATAANHAHDSDLAPYCDLLRCIYGNPFRPVAVDAYWAAWGDGVAPKLAQAIDDERAFDRMPILADALEEAGCADAELLGHLRSPGPHVRGCWALDLILGKE